MKQPVIVVAGETPPQWADALQTQFGDDFRVDVYTSHERYVSRLTDDRVALILVNGDEDWLYWTATPKSSPATRRIPIFLISESPHPEALTSGADLTMSQEDLMNDLQQLIADFARIPDPDSMAQLACDCAEPLPDLAQQGVEKFNAGEFYKQHDLFEELWMETESPVRDLYRAILQVGVAYYQITRGNHRGARKMLLRSVQWLTILPDACQGVDVKALREDSYRVRAALESLPEDRIAEFDLSLLQPVKLVIDQS